MSKLKLQLTMKPDTHNFWDIIAKMLTLAALLGGGWWTLYSYFDAEKQKVNSTFWNTRMTLYVRTSEAAAAIAAADTPAQVTKELTEFWTLYHGPMSVFEDDAVKKKMEHFSGFVRAFQGEGSTETGAITKPVNLVITDLSPAQLHQKKKDAAGDLTAAMRTSLSTSWSKPFDP